MIKIKKVVGKIRSGSRKATAAAKARIAKYKAQAPLRGAKRRSKEINYNVLHEQILIGTGGDKVLKLRQKNNPRKFLTDIYYSNSVLTDPKYKALSKKFRVVRAKMRQMQNLPIENKIKRKVHEQHFRIETKLMKIEKRYHDAMIANPEFQLPDFR